MTAKKDFFTWFKRGYTLADMAQYVLKGRLWQCKMATIKRYYREFLSKNPLRVS